MMMNRLFIVIFSLLFTVVFAQHEVEVIEPSYIKSVQLRPLKPDTYFPLVRLGEPIMLQFDDLNGNETPYEYKIEHCTHDWKISDIPSSVYSNGFTNDEIRDFENSFNTYQNYTHYKLTIPNPNISLKISGNYLLSVMDEDGNTVFTRKFIVYRPQVHVEVSAHRARKASDVKTKQNVEIKIDHSNLPINNPGQEVKIAIYQNGDWNSVKTDIEPQFYQGNKLIYKYGDKTTFWGGNEYLYFDTKDIRNASNNIRNVYLKDIYVTRLYADDERKRNAYTYNPDINGNFVIRSINEEDSLLESEYSKVHFGVQLSRHSFDGDVYVYGAFNNWRLTDGNKMIYNKILKYYEADILFKQGFHNYTYVSVSKDSILSTHEIEGSHFQTENEYNVIVYYSKLGARYDEVVGYGAASSIDLKN